MGARYWLIKVVAILIWGLPAPVSAAAGPRVLYVGDSLASETANLTGWWVQAPGDAEFRAETFGAMNICDFLTGVSGWIGPDRKLGALVRSYRPAAIALQFWGNPRWLSTCTAQRADNETFYSAIDRDAERAIAEISAAAVSAGIGRPRIVWVLQQPDRDNPNIPRRLNGIYAAKAARYGDLTSDAGRPLSMAAYPYPIPPEQKDRYAWTQFLPCTDFERQTGYCTHPEVFGGVTQLHQDNDPVHFCLGAAAPGGCTVNSPSILRYSMAIASSVRRAVGVNAKVSGIPLPAVAG